MGYMFMPLKRYFEFSGRSRRLEFWLWALFLNIVSAAFIAWMSGAFFEVISSLAQRAASGEFQGYAGDGVSSTVTYNGETYDVPGDVLWPAVFQAIGLQLTVLCVWNLFVFIPNLAVTVRRLHDTDRSGWTILLALIPLIGPLILLVFFFIEGTRGPNRFGPDPKAPAAGQTFS